MVKAKKFNMTFAYILSSLILLFSALFFLKFFNSFEVKNEVFAASWTDNGNYATSYSGGSGTQNSPFLISNARELARMAFEVNNKTVASSQHYKLTTSIDLSGLFWKPIGELRVTIVNGVPQIAEHYFKGSFDGDGFYIFNMQSNGGLFGLTHSAVIKNFFISGTITTSKEYVGSIINDAYNTTTTKIVSYVNINANSTIINSNIGGLYGRSYGANSSHKLGAYHGKFNITGSSQKSHIGVIFGQASGGLYENFVNYVNVTLPNVSGEVFLGGIFGYAENITASFLINYGNITSSSAKSIVGGIAGKIYSTSQITINNSLNLGNITASSASKVGGILGILEGGLSLSYTSNEGTVKGSNHIGGIVGYWTNMFGFAKISYAVNMGVVETSGNYIGGIVGYIAETRTAVDSSNTAYLENVTNTAKISGNEYVAGIIGFAYMGKPTGKDESTVIGAIKIDYAYNRGDITARYFGSGIIAKIDNGSHYVKRYNIFGWHVGWNKVDGGPIVELNYLFNEANIYVNHIVANDSQGVQQYYTSAGLAGSVNYYTFKLTHSFNTGLVKVYSYGGGQSGYISYAYILVFPINGSRYAASSPKYENVFGLVPLGQIFYDSENDYSHDNGMQNLFEKDNIHFIIKNYESRRGFYLHYNRTINERYWKYFNQNLSLGMSIPNANFTFFYGGASNTDIYSKFTYVTSAWKKNKDVLNGKLYLKDLYW